MASLVWLLGMTQKHLYKIIIIIIIVVVNALLTILYIVLSKR